MYNFFLEGNVEELEKLCGERALDLLKSITKINQMKVKSATNLESKAEIH